MKLRFQIGSNKPVGKPERENVLRGLLAEEMVDPEDLSLSEGFVQLGVQPDCAVQVVAEGLLHDDARTPHEVGRPEHVDHLERGLRRNAQVVQSMHVGAQRMLGFGHNVRQRLWARALRNEVELPDKHRQLVIGQSLDGELLHGAPGERAKRLVVVVVQ